jgi:hypothetical protein
MKKGINIFFTVMGSIMILFFLIATFFGEKNTNDSINDSEFGSDLFEKLQGIGILFLGIVKISMFFFVFLMMVLIPMILYRTFRSTDSDFEFIKEWGKYILIFLSGISLFSIAGVQLRSLKIDNEPTNVRVVPPSQIRVVEEQSSGKPKYLEDHFFYYNDSIKDWVLTSKIDYVKKFQKQSHLLYAGKSETKYYSKNSFGNWLRVPKPLFIKYKSNGAQTLKYTPIPEINYFLFASNEWKKITKEEFFKYRELDSIIRYE